MPQQTGSPTRPPPPLTPEPEPVPIWKRRGCKRLAVGCSCVGALALALLLLIGYLRARSFAYRLAGKQRLAQVSRSRQACLREFRRFSVPGDIQSLQVADVDSDGAAELALFCEADIVVTDQSGNQLSAFASGYRPAASVRIPGLPSLDTAVGSIRVCTIEDEPAILTRYGREPIHAYRSDGRRLWSARRAPGAVVWALEVADLDMDGKDEILIGDTSQQGLACLDGAGGTRWTFSVSGPNMGAQSIVVADANRDGRPEALASFGGHGVLVVDASGRQVGAWGEMSGKDAMIAADLDGDGPPEFLGTTGALFLSTRPPKGSKRFEEALFEVGLIGIRSDGSQEWQLNTGRGESYAMRERMAAGDFDGDGIGEWIVAVSDGTLRMYAKDGRELGRQVMGDYVSALAVDSSPGDAGKTRVWAAVGKEVVGLEWQKWSSN